MDQLQRDLVSKITTAASMISNSSRHGSANYMITSSYIYENFMKIDRNLHRKSKIEKIYGNLDNYGTIEISLSEYFRNHTKNYRSLKRKKKIIKICQLQEGGVKMEKNIDTKII